MQAHVESVVIVLLVLAITLYWGDVIDRPFKKAFQVGFITTLKVSEWLTLHVGKLAEIVFIGFLLGSWIWCLFTIWQALT